MIKNHTKSQHETTKCVSAVYSFSALGERDEEDEVEKMLSNELDTNRYGLRGGSASLCYDRNT